MFLRNKDAGFPLLSLNNYAEARRSCLQEVKLFSAHAEDHNPNQEEGKMDFAYGCRINFRS